MDFLNQTACSQGPRWYVQDLRRPKNNCGGTAWRGGSYAGRCWTFWRRWGRLGLEMGEIDCGGAGGSLFGTEDAGGIAGSRGGRPRQRTWAGGGCFHEAVGTGYSSYGFLNKTRLMLIVMVISLFMKEQPNFATTSRHIMCKSSIVRSCYVRLWLWGDLTIATRFWSRTPLIKDGNSAARPGPTPSGSHLVRVAPISSG